MKLMEVSPAVKFVLFFCIGIIAGKNFIINFYIILILCVLLLYIVLFSKNKNDYLRISAISLLIILSGIAKSNFDFHLLNKDSVINLNYNYTNCFVHGIVNDIPEYKKDRIRIVLDADKIIYVNDTLHSKGRFIVNIKNKKFKGINIPELKQGDEILIFGSMSDANDETNPGDFNYKYYLYLNDIDKIFNVDFFDDISVLSHNNLNPFFQYLVLPSRQYAIQVLNNSMDENEAAFLNGLVTGYRADFSKELKLNFINAGVMHLIAVSGLNVAYIIIFLTLIFSLLRIKNRNRIFIIVPLLIFYAFFAGGSASIIRAVIMGSLVLISLIVQRKINFYNIIAFSALLILLYDSRQLYDSGFILSYSAVLSLVYFMDKVTSFLERKKNIFNTKYRDKVITVISVLLSSFLVQLGTLPITLLFFEKISFIGYFSNVIAIPLSNISLALGFVQVLLAPLSHLLSSLVAETNFALLRLQILLINYFSSLPYSNIEFYGMTVVYAVIYYIILIILVTSRKSNIIFRLILSLIIIINFMIFYSLSDKEYTLTFLEAGKNGSVHIESIDGGNILIDAGMENYYTHITSGKVIPYLKRKNVGTIDLLILNRDISKSFNELYEISKSFKIKKLLYTTSEDFPEKITNLLSLHRIEAYNMNSINDISANGLKFYFFKTGERKAIKVYMQDKSCLIFNEPVKKYNFINAFTDFISSDIYRAPVSKIYESSTIEQLIKFAPKYAILNSEPENKIEAKLLNERFSSVNTKLFSTKMDKSIIFKIRKGTIELYK